MLSKLIEKGTSSTNRGSLNRRIRLVNQILPLIVIILCLFNVIDLLKEEYRFIPPTSVFALLFTIAWVINLYGYHKISRPLTSIILLILPVYFSAFFNRESGIIMIYISVACGQFMFYDFQERWKIGFFILLSILFMLFIDFVDYNIFPGVEKAPITYQKEQFKYYIIADILSLGLACFWLVKENSNSELKLKKQREKALNELQSKSEFLSIMSHEIRTPLSGIIGMSDLLMNTALSNRETENLNVLKHSADNLLDIVNDILDFSKIEVGKLVIEKRPINLPDFLNQIKSSVAHRVATKELDLIFEIDEDLPQFILGDANRLQQVFTNLLDNAIKFTHFGHIKLKASLVFKDNEDQCTIHFSVSDTGIGIPKEHLKHIFDSFTQASQSTSRKYGGTGLGIYLCKKIIRLFGGYLDVESKPNLGTSFSFSLPFKMIDVPQLSIKPENIEDVSLEGLRVLIVEDNLINQFVIKQLLQQYDISFNAVEDGHKALAELRTKNYDLVLLDYHMPDLDGLQTLQRIRAKSSNVIASNIPVIILTADILDEVKHKLTEAGCDDFLTKPIEQKRLLRALQKVIKNKEIDLRDSSDELKFINSPIELLFDISYVKRIIGEDPQIIKTLLNMALKKIPLQITDLKRYLKTKNQETQLRYTHDLKSNLKNIGLLTLSNKMNDIENLIHQKESIEVSLKLFEIEFENAKKEIYEWINNLKE